MVETINFWIFLWVYNFQYGGSKAEAEEINLAGAGASLPAEVYESWAPSFASFRNEFVPLENQYYTLGSGTGKSIFLNGAQFQQTLTYCGTDSVLTQAEKTLNPTAQMIPVLAGAVVLAYNLNTNLNSTLNLTMDQIVGIYNGSITYWNDSSIADINRNFRMPNARIRVVARADDSGTTEIFTATLSNKSQEWKDTYGRFSRGLDLSENPVHWNASVISLYGRTNRGMSGIVLSYRNSIGYVSVADAVVSQLRYANIFQDGHVVKLDMLDYTHVMERTLDRFGPDFTLDLWEYMNPMEYPFVGYSYFVVKMDSPQGCDLAVELVRYVEWILTDEFAKEEATGFLTSPMLPEITNRLIDEVLKNMYCEGDKNVYELVQIQKRVEWKEQAVWRIPFFIFVGVVAALLVLLITYIIAQHVRLERAILADDWRIDKEAIILKWTKASGLIAKGPGSALSLNVSTVSHLSNIAFTNVYGIGCFKDRLVCLRQIKLRKIDMHKKDVKKLLIFMRDVIQHNNVLRFYGIITYDTYLERYFVSDYCPKGTLSDIVQNEKYRIDDNIKFSLAMDIANGMTFLHNHNIIHGDLNCDHCLIDQRWNVRISEWENNKLENFHRWKKISKHSISPYDIHIEAVDPNIIARKLLWRDPELLLKDEIPVYNKHNDMYSFALILVEIFTREDPFSEFAIMVEPSKILEAVKQDGIKPDIRNVSPTSVQRIIPLAWNPVTEERPNFKQMTKILKNAKPSKKGVMDSMMEVLESYANHLEEKVAERTRELDAANTNLQNLLHQILPPSVAVSLSKGQSVEPEAFEAVTIFFSDIVGFTKLSHSSSPHDVVNMLNDLYTTFDSVLEHHDVYKVETIGDAYMVVSGLPTRNGDHHAAEICTMALDLLQAAGRFIIRHRPWQRMELRAGVHSGPVVAGVVGLKMPRYCLFGDTVNTASRMESTSLPLCIQVSQATFTLLERLGGFRLDIRGQMEVKGKGEMTTYFLRGKDGYTPLDQGCGRIYCSTYLRPE